MKFTIQSAEFTVLPMRTRFPFRYGIASLSSLPHLFLRLQMVVDDRTVTGISSEGLAPKWFTKDPDSTMESDLAEMLAVIQNASRISKNATASPVTFFTFWRDLYDEQRRWASTLNIPPLLANLGVSIIERAVLQGLCVAAATPLHRLIHSSALGIELGSVRRALKGLSLDEIIPPSPLQAVHVRHTIGLSDPLRTLDIPDSEVLHDGLPHSLEVSILAYGLRYFKIKLSGSLETDAPRLRTISDLLTTLCPSGFQVTMDGNECFRDLATFQDYYCELSTNPYLAPLFDSLILVEQPLHRSVALDETAVGDVLHQWTDGPPLIIDESDGSLDDLPRALALGYRGTSHKNCKGIVKSLANAALLFKHRAQNPDVSVHLSGEDLAGVGPVAMLQDLAMISLLGINHVERNGHHYFKGLTMYSEGLQAQVLNSHPDLYQPCSRDFPSLHIQNGCLTLHSVNHSPFGFSPDIPLDSFEPLNSWIKRGGIGEL
jgi:hypothetical protein